jgi:hypothetical protein
MTVCSSGALISVNSLPDSQSAGPSAGYDVGENGAWLTAGSLPDAAGDSDGDG